MVEKVNEDSSITGVCKVLDENFEMIVNGRAVCAGAVDLMQPVEVIEEPIVLPIVTVCRRTVQGAPYRANTTTNVVGTYAGATGVVASGVIAASSVVTGGFVHGGLVQSGFAGGVYGATKVTCLPLNRIASTSPQNPHFCSLGRGSRSGRGSAIYRIGIKQILLSVTVARANKQSRGLGIVPASKQHRELQILPKGARVIGRRARRDFSRMRCRDPRRDRREGVPGGVRVGTW